MFMTHPTQHTILDKTKYSNFHIKFSGLLSSQIFVGIMPQVFKFVFIANCDQDRAAMASFDAIKFE